MIRKKSMIEKEIEKMKEKEREKKELSKYKSMRFSKYLDRKDNSICLTSNIPFVGSIEK